MVHEYQAPIRVHKFTFEMVMAAYERRFPNCPQIPVVVECVVQEDKWSSDSSRRFTKRRCQLNVEAPYLLKKMVGVEFVYFIQTNDLDLKKRTMEIVATNETFASRIDVVEKCKYYVHPENPAWTCFEMSAFLDVKSFYGLESTAEKIAMKQYAATVAKGKELIEIFMEEVKSDGVLRLKPWSVEKPHHNRNIRHAIERLPLSPCDSPQSSINLTNVSTAGTSEGRNTKALSKAQLIVAQLICQGEEKKIHDGLHSLPTVSLERHGVSKPASDPKQKDQDKIVSSSQQDLPKWVEYFGSMPEVLEANAPSETPAKVPESPDPMSKASELTFPAILSGCLYLPVIVSSPSEAVELPKPAEKEPDGPVFVAKVPEGPALAAEVPRLRDHSGNLRQRPALAGNLSVRSDCRCLADTRTRWDFLMVMLVSVTLIMLILSTPLSIFFGRSRGRRRR